MRTIHRLIVKIFYSKRENEYKCMHVPTYLIFVSTGFEVSDIGPEKESYIMHNSHKVIDREAIFIVQTIALRSIFSNILEY